MHLEILLLRKLNLRQNLRKRLEAFNQCGIQREWSANFVGSDPGTWSGIAGATFRFSELVKSCSFAMSFNCTIESADRGLAALAVFLGQNPHGPYP
ncbi:hypothetical protein T05_1189 [Trichinella murrelli]|uniref:Uncharacterized protein n=1 Tax=Trichinella murrelli TaxID=144512 RepID=A0A0V0U9Q4_9BILA|nr:hypothetical protein T05_1189 [Trichinella murrelli]